MAVWCGARRSCGSCHHVAGGWIGTPTGQLLEQRGHRKVQVCGEALGQQRYLSALAHRSPRSVVRADRDGHVVASGAQRPLPAPVRPQWAVAVVTMPKPASPRPHPPRAGVSGREGAKRCNGVNEDVPTGVSWPKDATPAARASPACRGAARSPSGSGLPADPARIPSRDPGHGRWSRDPTGAGAAGSALTTPGSTGRLVGRRRAHAAHPGCTRNDGAAPRPPSPGLTGRRGVRAERGGVGGPGGFPAAGFDAQANTCPGGKCSLTAPRHTAPSPCERPPPRTRRTVSPSP